MDPANPIIDPEIISALIQACGTIIAAIIAALFARNIVKESVKPLFRSYSEKSHDLRDITEKATHDIFIVVAIGDKLLGNYLPDFEWKLKTGVRLRYLLLAPDRYLELEEYMHDKLVYRSEYFNTLQTLLNLRAEFPALVEIRAFHSYMTASYIGIDTYPELKYSHIIPSSTIQVMLYQYHVLARESLITNISPKSDEKYFCSTVSCMSEMWESATPISSMDDVEKLSQNTMFAN